MAWRDHVRTVVEAPRAQHAITVVISINAVTLGLETSPALTGRYGDLLTLVDHIALYIFVAELVAKMYVYRLGFLRDPWNIFDTLIIGISLLPHSGGLSVLRALRIMRALRLISAVPSLRRVVSALLSAVPGMASIAVLLSLVLYVAAVMATKLFSATSPRYFGDLGASLFTLFQVMTGEGWSEIAREVMAVHPAAWIFFVTFILICTFVVLNLFIAVVVRAMEEDHAKETDDIRQSVDGAEQHTIQAVMAELQALRAEMRDSRAVGPCDHDADDRRQEAHPLDALEPRSAS